MYKKNLIKCLLIYNTFPGFACVKRVGNLKKTFIHIICDRHVSCLNFFFMKCFFDFEFFIFVSFTIIFIITMHQINSVVLK